MRKISCSVGSRIVGNDCRAVIAVDNDATDEEIDEIVREWAANYVSWGWSEAPSDAKETK